MQPTRSERISVLAVGVAIHIAVLLLILLIRTPQDARPDKVDGNALVTFGVKAPAERQPPPPKLPSKIPAERAPLSPPSVTKEAINGSGPVSAGCTTLAGISNALLSDPAAVASIVSSPPEARSVAGAVVLWNSGWAVDANTLEMPLSPARAAIEKALAATEPDCLDEAVSGPRLIPIPAGEQTIFVVLGSGQWSWRDLMIEPLPQTDSTPEQSTDRTLLDWFSD